jgi:hypothetical protein
VEAQKRKYSMSGGKIMENIAEETKERERGEFFWHTYYGFPSEMLGWVLLVVTLAYFAFVVFVAIGGL